MEYFGRYRGLPVYKIGLVEFLQLDGKERRNDEKIWLINEDHKVIRNGMVFGSVVEKTKRLNEISMIEDYKNVYARQIRELAEKERERVVTERKTAEAFASEGAKKLNAVVHEAQKKVEENMQNGEARLQALAEEGVRKTRKVKTKVIHTEGV